MAAADHRILVWRRIARRCCRHPCHLRVRRTIGTNGAGCSGMSYDVCGLVCGALSAAPRGGGLAARGRPTPSSEHSVGQRRTSRARRFAAKRFQEHARIKQCALSWWQFSVPIRVFRIERGLKRNS